MKFFLTSLLSIILSFSFSQKLTWGPEFEDHSIEQAPQLFSEFGGSASYNIGPVELLGQVDDKIIGIIGNSLYTYSKDGALESSVKLNFFYDRMSKNVNWMKSIKVFNNKIFVFSMSFDKKTKTTNHLVSEVLTDGSIVTTKTLFTNSNVSGNVYLNVSGSKDGNSLIIENSYFNKDKKKMIVLVNTMNSEFELRETPIEFVSESSSSNTINLNYGRCKVLNDGSLVLAAMGLVKSSNKDLTYLDFAKYKQNGELIFSNSMTFNGGQGGMLIDIVLTGQDLSFPVLVGYYSDDSDRYGVWSVKVKPDKLSLIDIKLYKSQWKSCPYFLFTKSLENEFKLFQYNEVNSTLGPLNILAFDNGGNVIIEEGVPVSSFEEYGSLILNHKSFREDYYKTDIIRGNASFSRSRPLIGFWEKDKSVNFIYYDKEDVDINIDKSSYSESYRNATSKLIHTSISEDVGRVRNLIEGDLSDFLIIPGINLVLDDGSVAMLSIKGNEMRLAFVK